MLVFGGGILRSFFVHVNSQGELKTGEMYRGHLMNCEETRPTKTAETPSPYHPGTSPQAKFLFKENQHCLALGNCRFFFFSHFFFQNWLHPIPPHAQLPKKQDNMNAMLEGVTVTGRDGKVTNLEQAGTLEAAKSQSQILGHVKAFVGKVLDWDLVFFFDSSKWLDVVY